MCVEPPPEDPDSPQQVFLDAMILRATGWILRLDCESSGYHDWMTWCVPYVMAKLQVASWTEEAAAGRSIEQMAQDICYGCWQSSGPGRRNVIEYMNWVGRRESHESWERAVRRHFRALRHTRSEMRLYLGNAAPPAVREYREDSDGEILPSVG
eukprot:7886574-Pyramimonas_sp.AAC.1